MAPLSESYGASTKDVYLHISKFVNEDYSDAFSRDLLKSCFRRAARRLGIPVSGNQPTELFFAPLGPVRSQHAELARAFVGAALYLGPPAIEDTPSARHWQRRAVAEHCPTFTRLRATINFDTSAYCARRFEAWRQGKSASGTSEKHLFDAFDAAARSFGRSRGELVGPPRLYWARDNLALEAEASRLPQRVHIGAFPILVSGGNHVHIPAPWPDDLTWSCGNIRQQIAFAPGPGNVLLFDADSGAFLTRLGRDDTLAEIAAERLVVLSRVSFSCASFGDAIPSRDLDIYVAWVEATETLVFDGRADITLQKPDEAALWLDAVTLGRDGPQPLYACDGALILRIDPEIGGAKRIVRARMAKDVRFLSIEVGADGFARLPFYRFGLGEAGDPRHVVFEVLAPGAAGDLNARAELSTSCWIWCGVPAPDGDLCDVDLPSNFDASRSAGLRCEGGKLSVDPRADAETPILSLYDDKIRREFHLAARGEKLWHCRISTDDRIFVPKGKVLVFGHDARHDTFRLRSSDRDADLLVLGREKRRPFLTRQSLEIGAEDLEATVEGDDRIALRRANGHIDILARLRRVADPAEISLTEDENCIDLSLLLQRRCDALHVKVESVDGSVLQGEFAFGRFPVSLSPLGGVDVTSELDSGRISVRLLRTILPAPARVRFWVRNEKDRTFAPLCDAAEAQIAIGLAGSINASDRRSASRLAGFLAEPEAEALGGQLSAALGPSYRQALGVAGTTHMIGAIRPVLNVHRADGQPPRNDLVGVAPWIFQAPLSAYSGLEEASGLSSLAHMASIGVPAAPPDPAGDTPLSDWLDRVSSDTELPQGLDATSLSHAFRALRFRLRETDLRCLAGNGHIGSAVAVICQPHIEGLEALRSFDSGGGGDLFPARLAAGIERFARACAGQRADAFIDNVEFRTGLPRQEIGQTLTMMLRAGIEFFVHFRALWSHAEQLRKVSA
ncbi:hypothetical protein D1F64_14290 [Breoghania sp. L-A4]|nr:hypothetical protein D1F64_14290 [Breoghania sp. L-A4]